LFLNSQNFAKGFTGKKWVGSHAHDYTVFSVISPTVKQCVKMTVKYRPHGNTMIEDLENKIQ